MHCAMCVFVCVCVCVPVRGGLSATYVGMLLIVVELFTYAYALVKCDPMASTAWRATIVREHARGHGLAAFQARCRFACLVRGYIAECLRSVTFACPKACRHSPLRSIMAKPVTVARDVIRVEGGYLASSAQLHLQLLPAHGSEYVCLRKADRRLQEFLGGNFEMLDKLVALRNELTSNMIDESDAPDRDPFAVAVATAGPATKSVVKRKREVFKELSLGPIALKVETSCGGSYVVKVLPHWHCRGVFRMESVQKNFELLLLTPAHATIHDPDEFKPTFEHTSRIKWNCANHSVYCAYWKGGKWKRKTRKVERGTDDAETQSRVDDAALKLEEFWRNNHEDPEGSEAASASDDL